MTGRTKDTAFFQASISTSLSASYSLGPFSITFLELSHTWESSSRVIMQDVATQRKCPSHQFLPQLIKMLDARLYATGRILSAILMAELPDCLLSVIAKDVVTKL